MMGFICKLLATLFFLGAVYGGLLDIDFYLKGDEYTSISVEQIWRKYGADGFYFFQSRIIPDIQSVRWMIIDILNLPAWVVFSVISLIFFLIGSQLRN